MSKGWYVTATNIVKWTENSPRQAQEILPLLVKRLIFARINPSIIRFPSGNSIVQSGWDGILKTDSGNAFIPMETPLGSLAPKKASPLSQMLTTLKGQIILFLSIKRIQRSFL
jgi:hypothetical protein